MSMKRNNKFRLMRGVTMAANAQEEVSFAGLPKGHYLTKLVIAFTASVDQDASDAAATSFSVNRLISALEIDTAYLKITNRIGGLDLATFCYAVTERLPLTDDLPGGDATTAIRVNLVIPLAFPHLGHAGIPTEFLVDQIARLSMGSFNGTDELEADSGFSSNPSVDVIAHTSRARGTFVDGPALVLDKVDTAKNPGVILQGNNVPIYIDALGFTNEPSRIALNDDDEITPTQLRETAAFEHGSATLAGDDDAYAIPDPWVAANGRIPLLFPTREGKALDIDAVETMQNIKTSYTKNGDPGTPSFFCAYLTRGALGNQAGSFAARANLSNVFPAVPETVLGHPHISWAKGRVTVEGFTATQATELRNKFQATAGALRLPSLTSALRGS